MAQPCGADLLITTLTSLDVSLLFGIPGIHNLDIYDRLLDGPIRHVTSRNEAGAAFMADGYARATGHPGVALVISGPGLTNALTALGEARHDAVPLVLISSDIPRRYRNGPHGYLHQLESPTTMTASVTKERIRVENASEIEPALRYLFGVATAGRPGPVHLEIPIDVLQEPIVPEVPVETVVSLAESARRPWIVAGGGAVGAAREVRELAAKLDALVVTTAAGKGVLPEDDARSVGGRLHIPAVRAELEASDLVFVVGSQLSSTDLWVDRLAFSGTVVNINIDGAHLTAGAEPDVAIRGDAATVLRELTAALPEGTARTRGERRTGTETLRERAVSELPGVLGLPEATVVRMRTVLAQIAAGLGPTGILAADMTTIAYCGISEFPTARPGGFLHPAGFGTLGFALPAAIGALAGVQAGAGGDGGRGPTGPVAVLAGDGGFQFTLQELAVAVQEQLPLPIVIWNDNGYGEIRREEEARHAGRRIAVDNFGPDFCALARSYGAAAERVDDVTTLAERICAALKRPGPTVLEVAGTAAAGKEASSPADATTGGDR